MFTNLITLERRPVRRTGLMSWNNMISLTFKVYTKIKLFRLIREIHGFTNITTHLFHFKMPKICLEFLAQLTNAEIARPDVVTCDLTVVCQFNLSRLPLYLRQKTKMPKI